MKKLKHSKYKNTGILFELFGKTNNPIYSMNNALSANKLLKKHFAENTCLGKEQRLYQLLIEECTSDTSKAESLLQVVIENHKKLSTKELATARYELVKDIKESYQLMIYLEQKLKIIRHMLLFSNYLKVTIHLFIVIQKKYLNLKIQLSKI